MPKNKKMGRAIREAREQNALTQEDLAKRMNVSQGTVSNWERGHEPDKQTQAKLKSILGQNLFGARPRDSVDTSIVSEWLSKARQDADLTVPQLAEKSRLSVPTIYNIEAGRAQNPRQRTIELLEKAVGKKFEAEFQKSIKEAS